MGKLEERNRQRLKKGDMQRVILNTVKVAGLVSLALLAPNVIGALSKLGLLPRSRQKEYVASSASKLLKRGLLKFENGRYQLTGAGETRLHRWELTNYLINKPKKWDKKWRVVIFDIPEKKRKIRNNITNLFRVAGLKRLQDSVWVFPYDCEDMMGLLKTDFGVGKYMLYLIVDEIENDKRLREDFGLV